MRRFTYHFITEAQTFSHTHSIGLELTQEEVAALPDWTRLEYQQCKGCRWNASDRCPVAVGLVRPAALLGKLRSYEAIEVEVEAPERTYRKTTTVQEGLSGLFGLIMASSGCPTFDFLKGLAWYHLPFASFEETLFRSTAAYLLVNYLKGEQRSADDAVQQIKALYDNIKHTNIGITERLRHGVVPLSDSPMNAVVILDSFGALVPMSVDSGLEDLKAVFL